MSSTFAIYSLIGLVYPKLSLAAIARALGTVIADSFPWQPLCFMIDDNLSIPIAVGIFMALTTLLYNIIL